MIINELVVSITDKIDELKSLSENFGNRDDIPKIEIDLALEKTRSLYDALLKLCSMGRDTMVMDKIVEKVIPEEAPVTEEEPVAEIPKVKPVEKVKKPKPKEKEPVVTNEPLFGSEVTPKQESPAKEIIVNRFQNQPSFNERMAKTKMEKDLASKMADKPILDIKTAIGINDRFEFTNVLFEGNSANFNKTVDYLNNCTTLDEALSFINSNFAWNSENPSFIKFIELVYRRHVATI